MKHRKIRSRLRSVIFWVNWFSIMYYYLNEEKEEKNKFPFRCECCYRFLFVGPNCLLLVPLFVVAGGVGFAKEKCVFICFSNWHRFYNRKKTWIESALWMHIAACLHLLALKIDHIQYAPVSHFAKRSFIIRMHFEPKICWHSWMKSSHINNAVL